MSDGRASWSSTTTREMCELLEAGLAQARLRRSRSRTRGDDGARAARRADFDVVVTDLNMRGMNGLELCERVVANRPDIPVVVITAFGSLETAVARDPRRRLRLHHQAVRARGARD